MKYVKSLDSLPINDLRWLKQDFSITYHWLVNSVYTVVGLIVIAILVYFIIGYFYIWYCEYKLKRGRG
jgi:hypothetical protein